MEAKRKGKLLAIYSVGHFTVDLACAFLMFSLPSSGTDRLLELILYNFCAFALQMPVGLIADRLDRNGLVAVIGSCLTLIAFILIPIPLACVVILGLGNCFYHVGGGVDVLNFSEKKQWMLGVFVSPGAIGLFIGTVLANSRAVSPLVCGLILLGISCAIILSLNCTHPLRALSGNACFDIKPKAKAPILAFICLFTVVILRSYVGMTLYMPWKSEIPLLVISVLGLAFGKTAGGFLADRVGEMRTAIASLALSSVLFLFSSNAVCGLLSIFLFNMTMPLTLFAMARIFPNARGFSFGCLTFALFLGCVPELLSLPTPFFGKAWFYAIEAAVSLLLLALGLLASRERKCINE